ncbi:TPA: HNH endonuclease [Enterobacter bugandensis]|nr:HNH endonuclease [Enterobacter bugandensis]
MASDKKINVSFEKISPTPGYPKGITKSLLTGKRWENSKGRVPTFKKHLKEKLRGLQHGRCAYCRRFLGLVADTDIEHIIEKAVYANFTYEILNLALSCSDCNSSKNLHSQLLKKALKKTNNIPPFLSSPIPNGSAYPNRSEDYRWVHPHFDEYSLHISILKGWIYKSKSAKGAKQIRFLGFNKIGKVEKNMRIEKLNAASGVLSKIIFQISQSGYENYNVLVSELYHGLLKRK